MDTPENKQKKDEYVPVEQVSYSLFFFLVSGALLLVTLWSFWDDEYGRRGYKKFQEKFYKAEYSLAKEQWKKVNEKIKSKEDEIRENLQQEEGKLEESPEFKKLLDEVTEAKIHLEDANTQRKFTISRLDEAYYYYKKAQHLGENFSVRKALVADIQKEIEAYDPVIAKLEQEYNEKEANLLKFKARKINLEAELSALVGQRESLQRQMDFYKPFPFVWKFSEIKQAVIPGARKNNFKEITYKVDRCMTCHIAYDNPNFENAEHPLKTHPNRGIYIKKHPPDRTGCTWCHKGQGPVTAP
ncbi:MAG: cytochrome C, partial [Nitrospinales bacterium]